MPTPNPGPTDCSSGLSARIFNNLRYDNPWQALQSGVQVGTRACPTVPNGIGFLCTAITTGITGATEPVWPSILGNTVVDGGVTWTAQDVANPTGKAHTPTGQFGYVLTATDLDGYRLFAYDVAKGAADEMTSVNRAAAHATVNQSMVGPTFATINYDTVDADTASQVVVGSGWTFTCKSDGLYLVTANVNASPTVSGGDTLLALFKGSGEVAYGTRVVPTATTPYGLTLAHVLPLVVNDTLSIRFFGPTATWNLEAAAITGYQNRNRIEITQLLGF